MLVYDSIIVNGGFLGSNRKLDENGYLRVKTCNITKEQVAPYLGKEIPNWKDFNLESDKIYYVYRPKDELEKAVETFDNLPLTREHIEVDTENVPKDKIVGSLGDRAEFKSPYIKNSLIVYDQKDIDWIMSGKKKELSCGYRYTPVQKSGEFDGKHYDFIMTDIIGNHVALVKEGRAGHDVMVADEKPIEMENIMIEDEFKESEHPREKNGQFTSKGGESGGSIEKSVFVVKNKDNNTNERKFNSKEEAEKWISGQLEPIYGKERSELKELRDKSYSISKEKEETHKELIDGSEKESSGERNKRDLTGHDVFLKMVRKPSNLDEVKNESRNNGTDKVKVVETIDLNDEDYDKLTKYPLRDYDFLKGKGGYDEEGNRTAVAIRTKGKPTLVIDPSGSSYARYMGIFYDNLEEENKNMINDSSEQEKVGIVMKEFKEGKLKSGSGEKVTDPKQAIAIALSEAGKAKDEDIPDEQDKPETAGEEKAEKEDNKMEDKKKESLAEDKCAKDEKVDKRKLIDEIGGILKGKVDEELWKTVIGKAEKIAYNESEVGTANDEDKIESKKDFAEGVVYGEKKEKEEPKKLDSEHESEGMKKFEEKKESEDKCATDKCDGKMAKDEMTFDIDTIKAQVRQEVIEDFKAREEARKAVKSTVGDVNVMAFDSCEDIYKFACEKAGMNLSEIASYKDAFKGFSAGKALKGGLALDATPKSSGNVEECLKDIRS